MFFNRTYILICFTVASLSGITTGTAQSTQWFDAEFNMTSREKAAYYRPMPKKTGDYYYIIDYYKNGNKFREGKAKSYQVAHEEFEGLLTFFFNNGVVAEKINYSNGKKNGLYAAYYISGDLKEDGSFLADKREGNWRIFYKNGKIKSKGKYRDGEKVGVWKTFYKNVY